MDEEKVIEETAETETEEVKETTEVEEQDAPGATGIDALIVALETAIAEQREQLESAFAEIDRLKEAFSVVVDNGAMIQNVGAIEEPSEEDIETFVPLEDLDYSF